MQSNKLKEKNLRSRILVFVIIAFALVMTLFQGVDGDGDITNKLVAVALGVDYEGGLIKVTLSSVLPKPGSSEGGAVVSVPVSASGESIAKCLYEIERTTGKSMELGLCGVVVLGEKLAQEGALVTASVLLSGVDVSPGAYLVQADGCSAEEIIRKSTSLTYNSATVLTMLMTNAEKNTGISTITLLRFVSDSYGKTRSAYAPLISMKEANKLSGSAEEGGSGEKFETQSISRCALYKGGVLVGKLSEKASRGLSYSDKHSKKGALVCPDFLIDGINAGTLSAEIASGDVKIKTRFDNGVPRAEIEVELTLKSGDRERVNAVAMQKNLSVEQIVQAFDKNYNEVLKSEVTAAYEEAKQYDCDVFGLEQNCYRSHTKQYGKYSDSGNFFRDCKTTIKTKIKIQ